MDRLRAAVFGRSDDLVTDQIALIRGRGADMHGLVRHAHMQRVGISVRIDRDGANAELARSADDAAGDFAAIGDKEGFKHEGPRLIP